MAKRIMSDADKLELSATTIASLNTRIAELESALAAERARADALAQALEELRSSWIFLNASTGEAGAYYAQHPLELEELFKRHPNSVPRIIEKTDAALSDWRTARGAK